jgi:hypothetical protein
VLIALRSEVRFLLAPRKSPVEALLRGGFRAGDVVGRAQHRRVANVTDLKTAFPQVGAGFEVPGLASACPLGKVCGPDRARLGRDDSVGRGRARQLTVKALHFGRGAGSRC